MNRKVNQLVELGPVANRCWSFGTGVRALCFPLRRKVPLNGWQLVLKTGAAFGLVVRFLYLPLTSAAALG